MFEKTFITGTANHLIVHIGTNKKLVSESSYIHAVSMNDPKSVHVSHFGAFSAPLICSYAKTNLSEIEQIIIMLRIPDMPNYTNDTLDKSIGKIFQVEWYFTTDLIRQSLQLFQKKQFSMKDISFAHQKNAEGQTRGKLCICIPKEKRKNMSDSQIVYYRSIVAAIETFIKEFQTQHQIALLYLDSVDTIHENVQDIYHFLQKILRKKNIHRRIFYQHNFLRRLLGKA